MKQSICLLKMNLKNYKKLIQASLGINYFLDDDGTQNYLVFQPIYRYFKRVVVVGSDNYIYIWKSKGLSDEMINSMTTSNYSITPELHHYGTKVRVKFSGSCLKQDKATFIYDTIVNIYIVYEMSKKFNISSYPTLENCLCEAVSLTKHVDIDQYNYSGYGTGFYRKGVFPFGNVFGRNVIISGGRYE